MNRPGLDGQKSFPGTTSDIITEVRLECELWRGGGVSELCKAKGQGPRKITSSSTPGRRGHAKGKLGDRNRIDLRRVLQGRVAAHTVTIHALGQSYVGGSGRGLSITRQLRTLLPTLYSWEEVQANRASMFYEIIGARGE